MGKTGQILAAGLVAIGMATALFSPGRQTVAGIQAGGTAGSGLFKAAEGTS
jgi:hypothetical protein